MMETDDGRVADGASAAFKSPTFDKDGSFRVNEGVGSASISPGGRDVVLGSRQGLHIIDLDNPYSPPRFLPHRQPWEVADVQWSPFAARDYWIVSTSNQKALVWNLELTSYPIPIEHVLHAHTRAITDINFSAHEPDLLATCAVDSFIYCWDLRAPATPVLSFSEWTAGATQVKWNRQDPNILASSHEKALFVWDRRQSSRPLRVVQAHTSKIYGIDWSRVKAERVLTCSSDRTIKLWDYNCEEDIPERVMRTSFPIWRARHTPFGHGILAMPTRGNNDIHLYDERLAPQEDNGTPLAPTHTFDGHGDQVKEFLWRVRHGTAPGVDDRAFQLVSWGLDRNLMLHRVDDSLLAQVGHIRGQAVDRRFNFTRIGATYRTFHELPKSADVEHSPSIPRQALIDLYRGGGSKNMAKSSPYLAPLQLGMRVRGGENKSPNAIAWMKGVKIFTNREDTNSMRESISQMTASSLPPWDAPETLGDEIAEAGTKYKRVVFDDINVPSRTIVISMNGPWGPDKSSVHLKAHVQFPTDYPQHCPPSFDLEKTSSISAAEYVKMKVELKTLCDAYVSVGRGCLEAALCYLVGERTLQESMKIIEEATAGENSPEHPDDSSSDDDDEGNIGIPFNKYDLDISGTDALVRASANAATPLPKMCGALWADCGQLVCFFPEKDDRMSLSGSGELPDLNIQADNKDILEAFGWLNGRKSMHGKPRDTSKLSSPDAASSSASSTASSFSELSSDGDPSFHPLPWAIVSTRLTAVRSRDKSGRLPHQSSSKLQPKITLEKPNMTITLQTPIDLPSKKCLAEGYMILGKGPIVCAHNARVAASYGFDELADVWRMLQLLLHDRVPLFILPQEHRHEEVLVLAERVLVHINRKESGLDLKFDQQDAVVNPQLTGRVKWGQHPLSGSWLIDILFKHYESIADVQTLAMLSCVLAEPAALEDASRTMRHLPDEDWPMALTTPAFSLDYFPSIDVVRSQFHDATTAVNTQKSSAAPPLGTFGSLTSSNGPWGSDATQVDHLPHELDEESPPLLTRRSSRGSNVNTGASYGTPPVPELKRSNSISAFAASFSRAAILFGTSQSPPVQRNEPALSSSAPTSGPGLSSMSRGMTTLYEDNTSGRPGAQAHSVAVFDDDLSSGTWEWDDEEVEVKLKNQDLFDDEGCIGAPLLRPEYAGRYAGYRAAYAGLLDVWELHQQRCEILKVNGLATYFKPQTPIIESLAHDEDDQTPNAAEKVGTEDTSSPVKSSAQTPVPHPMTGEATTEPITDFQNGVYFAGYCDTCGRASALKPRTVARGANSKHPAGQCSFCSTPVRTLVCSICGEAIRGMCTPCLACGHAAHTSCRERWLGTVDSDPDNEDEDRFCDTGCGCDCGEDGAFDPTELIHFDDLADGSGYSSEVVETEADMDFLPAQRGVPELSTDVGEETGMQVFVPGPASLWGMFGRGNRAGSVALLKDEGSGDKYGVGYGYYG